MTDGNRRKKAQAVFFSIVMVLSMVGGTVALAGSAAAAVNDVTGDTANNVEIGQTSTTQDVTFSTSIDGASSTESYTLDVDSANIDPASVSIAGNGDDISLGGSGSTDVSVGSVTDNTDTDGTIAIDITDDATGAAHSFTITATLTHDTSGISAETGTDSDSYTLSDAGGSSNQGTVSFSLVDTTAPTISNPSPGDSTFVNDSSQTYTVDITDSGSGVDESSIVVTVTDNDGTPLDGVGTDNNEVSYSDGTLTIDSQNYADGEVTVTVDADDNAGNSAERFSSTFTVDTESPSVGVENPSDGDIVQSQDEISGTASDNNEVSSVDLTITNSSGDTWNGESFTSDSTAVAATNYDSEADTWTYDSSAIEADDTYTVSATATDDAGNTNTSDSVEYTLDNNSLAVGIDDPSDGEFVQSQDEISGTATDDNEVSSVDLTIENGDGTWNGESFTADSTTVEANYDSENGTWAYDSSALEAEDTYTVSATATDAADNTDTTDPVEYTIDTTDPAIDDLGASFDADENNITVTLDASESLDLSATTVSIQNASGDEVGTVTGDDWEEVDGEYVYEGTYKVTQKADETFSANLSTAADLAGNGVEDPSPNNDTVDVDTSALDLSIDSPTSQLNLTSDSEFDLQYSYSDTNPDSVEVGLSTNEDGSNPAYTYDINDSQYADDDAQKTLTIDLSENVEGDVEDLTDDEYYATVTTEDAESGTSTATTDDSVVVVDDEAPTFSEFGEEDTSSTETNFSVDISDNVVGVDESSIVVDVTQDDATQTLYGGEAGVEFADGTLTVDTQNSSLELSEGPVTVNYTAADYSGNSADDNNNEFTINTAAPAIDSVEAEAGEDDVTVTFTEDVKADDGVFSKDDFAYTDVSGGDATEIDSVSADTDDDGYTDVVTLTLDEEVGVDDLDADEVNARDAALSDRNDDNVKSTAAATVALADTTDPASPGLTVGNVTAENEGSYDVTVTADTAATANITVKNSSGDVFAEETNVELDASSSTTEQLDLTDIENGDVTIEATVNDRGVDLTSEDTAETVQKDNESATIESIQTDAGTNELEVTFSEDVTNVDGNLDAENLTINDVSGDDATYTLTVDEPVAPSDIDNESVTVSATTQIEDIVGTDADTSAVSLEDGSAPGVEFADASNGTDTVDVYFNESVYNASDDGLSADDFTYVNNSGVSHTVESVEHTAGDRMATVTLDSSLTSDDLNSDVIEVTANDSVDKQTTTGAVISEIVDIDNFEVSNTTDTSAKEVQISFTSDEELDTLTVNLDTVFDLAEFESDNGDVELTEEDFEVTAQDDGTYDYTYNYTVPRDGEYDAELTDATAVGGSPAFQSPVDIVSVDYDDPEPVDAEIVEVGQDSTTVAVQFSEPVIPDQDGANLQNVTVAGESATDVNYAGASNAWEFEFNGVVATGDGQNVAFDEETVEEFFGDETSVEGTSETVDTHEFHLEEGVNFVSVPAEFGSLDIADSEFSDMTVMTYEDGEWVSYAPDKSADNQGIESMEGGQGYVVSADSDATVDVTVRNEEPGDTAEDATPGQQQLQEGWNLVGHWQEGSQSDDAALASMNGDSTATNVYGQSNDGEFSYAPVDTFEPGEAYWVFLEDDEVYTASNYQPEK